MALKVKKPPAIDSDVLADNEGYMLVTEAYARKKDNVQWASFDFDSSEYNKDAQIYVNRCRVWSVFVSSTQPNSEVTVELYDIPVLPDLIDFDYGLVREGQSNEQFKNSFLESVIYAVEGERSAGYRHDDGEDTTMPQGAEKNLGTYRVVSISTNSYVNCNLFGCIFKRGCCARVSNPSMQAKILVCYEPLY